jgi:hypothetical protein
MCSKFGPTWDPDEAGQERCEGCLIATGWEFDASDEDRDGRWSGKWTLGREGKDSREAAMLPAHE